MALLKYVQPSKDLLGALNTVQHHDMHHRFPTRHFSLYFTHWDRWCGTEHPAYCEQVQISPVDGRSAVQLPRAGILIAHVSCFRQAYVGWQECYMIPDALVKYPVRTHNIPFYLKMPRHTHAGAEEQTAQREGDRGA